MDQMGTINVERMRKRLLLSVNGISKKHFPSNGACMSEIRGAVKEYSNCDAGNNDCVEEDAWFRRSYGNYGCYYGSSYNRGYYQIELFCYPDTIDPRKK